MDNCCAVSTPMVECELKEFWNPSSILEPFDKVKCQELLVSLLYLSIRTRTDIVAAIEILCRKKSCLTNMHWKMFNGVLQYFKGTISYALGPYKGYSTN